MDKITRYLILLIIIVVFFILAPIIVIYVSGKNLQFSDVQLAKDTGIIDIQSQPSDAEVYLNGNKLNNTPTTIRFVKQGTYKIEIKKSGFKPWQKELFIEASKVTYVGNLNNEVRLLPDQQLIILAEQKIESFVLKNHIVYFHSKDNQFGEYDLNEKIITKQTKLPIAITNLKTTSNDNYLLATSQNNKNILVDLSTQKLINLPEALNSNVANLDIDSRGNIFAVKANELLVSNLSNQRVTPLLENTLTFTLNNQTLYIAKVEANGLIISTSLYNGIELLPQTTLLKQPLPEDGQYQLLLTYQKELFLSVNQSLYRVNQQLDLLNNKVTSIQLDKIHRQLNFQTPSEIYYYNFLSNKAELFHRFTKPIQPSLVIPNLGYGFVGSNTNLEAIEIDNRNGQNRYQLSSTGPVSLLTTTDDEKNLLFLANDQLAMITIAN